ncbi:hypothetical protein NBRC116589_25070 [Ruegeria sp. HU-ET01832]
MWAAFFNGDSQASGVTLGFRLDTKEFTDFDPVWRAVSHHAKDRGKVTFHVFGKAPLVKIGAPSE